MERSQSQADEDGGRTDERDGYPHADRWFELALFRRRLPHHQPADDEHCDADGIAIIDQHVAHERVLFERVMEKLSSGRMESQRLLEPMLVELSPEGRQALLSHADDLDRLGFGVDDFGGETLRVTRVPALLSGEDAVTAIRALAEDLEGLDRGREVGDALRRIAATTACHAAVKANYPLTHEKMMHILEELRRTAYSTVCPHGRPVMLRLTRREIEKNFQRI